MTRKQKAAATAAALLLVAVVTAVKIRGSLLRGEPIFWLEALWAPAAFLSIGLVTCLEFLLADAPPAKPASLPRRRKKGLKRLSRDA